jgi:hypothetical protein
VSFDKPKSMRGRVAWAICQAAGIDPSRKGNECAWRWQEFLDGADAALEELMNGDIPDHMLIAGAKAIQASFGDPDLDPADFAMETQVGFVAAIGAALAERDGDPDGESEAATLWTAQASN